jgi:hypothetical protein
VLVAPVQKLERLAYQSGQGFARARVYRTVKQAIIQQWDKFTAPARDGVGNLQASFA